MKMSDSEIEKYLASTLKVPLPNGDCSNQFIMFARSALELLRNNWPSLGERWVLSIQEANGQLISPAKWSEIQSEISAFRTTILKQPYSMAEKHNSEAAITFLFALSIISPNYDPHEYSGAQLVQLIDIYSLEFIEHFGQTDQLTKIISEAFHV